MRIGCVDFVSNTFFPATAAEELGFFRAEGVEAHVELLRTLVAFPALRDGEVDFLAAPAHSVLRAFPDWKGAKLVVALAQGTPWLVVLRTNVPGERGDLSALKGLRIAAAQGPNLVFRQFLVELGLQPGRDVEIVSLPGGEDADVNFGVMAARALEAGAIDGFFANAMGAEVSIKRRIGRIHIDARRDGTRYAAVSRFTFAALITTDNVIARRGHDVAAVVRGIVKAQQALRAEPARATEVGRRRFPPDEAALIASLVERDRPFYDPRITEQATAGVNALAQGLGLIKTPIPYERMVAGVFRNLWAL
ncbi:MAG: ABC transporter substrate-binding protein [Xanthobacteraceae bacterium]|nr:ABC transporter substrate-binding protein [Xanthobacteraceae bacterium]